MPDKMRTRRSNPVTLTSLRIRRVDIRRALTEDGFTRTLLSLSLAAAAGGAVIGLVGAHLAPAVFVPV